MPLTVLLCDTSDEIDRLQYHLMRADPDLAIDLTVDAFRAVEVAARSRPDVIVCELTLEGIGGTELIKRFRASAPTSRVIASTQLRDPERAAQVLSAGAVGYVIKEDGPLEVRRAIRSVIEGGVTLSPTAAAILAGELSRAVSDARASRAELARVRDTVAQGTSAKADFLANISHELRTPVTVAKGIAYVLKNPSVPSEERAEFLGQLQASLDKLMGIVDEIITIAELERGTFELDLAEVDLAPVLRHAVEDVGRQYPNVWVEAQLPGVLVAVADGNRIGAVAKELLDNACRYSPSECPVEVRARRLDQGVVFSVTDRGEGLDRAVATRSFEEPFTTGEATLRKERAGIGAGLHLARQLIVEHGGILWADPLPGGGTRASFCIPLQAGQNLDAPPAGTA